jgi:serine/threonine protein kinase
MSYSDYRILGLVGQGSFGRVFCAIDRRDCQLVALKELLRQRFATKQFLRELNFLFTLRHPHIVSCKSIEYHAKARYLVTDYCEGGSLQNLLNSNRKLRLSEILNLTIEILSGLEYIHRHQVVHGDIKPENILLVLNPNGWVAKIADFGIAKFEQEISRGMGLGGTGTPAYMAPECFYGKSSQASDLYAVGVILYELLVGERPFSGTIKDLTACHIARIPTIPTTIPFLLRSILSKALEKLPYNRFASAAEMRDALRLAIATLTKKEIESKKYLRHNFSNFSRRSIQVIDSEILTETVTSIVAIDGGVYLGSAREIKYIGDRFSWRLSLPNYLVELKPCGDGCMAIVRSTQRPITIYYGYYFPANLAFPNLDSCLCFSLQCDRFQITTAAKANWFITTHNTLDRTIITQIWRLQGFKVVSKRQMSMFPRASVILDRRHAAIVSSESIDVEKTSPIHQNTETYLSLCNRRGDWFVNNFSIPIAIESLITRSIDCNSILAIEKKWHDRGAIIDLKPYQIRQIDFEIEANFAVAANWGFCVASHRGELLLLDVKGRLLARENLPEIGKILTIAAWGDDRLLICSWLDRVLYLSTIAISV